MIPGTSPFRELRPALVVFAALTLLTGGLYPLIVTGAARLLFPAQAEGSLVRRDGVVRGSSRVGQHYAGAGWFHGRPSATTAHPYNPLPSTGANRGPLHPALAAAFRTRAASLRAADDALGALPVDLLTTSASGLDPDVSPDGARAQVARVARERGLTRTVVAALVARHVEGRQFGVLGEPRVNVLRLNLALDSLARANSR